MIRPYCVAFLVCAATAFAAPGAAPAGAGAALARVPLRFEANQGQFDRAVRFAARGAGFHFTLTSQGPSLRFAQEQAVNLSLLDSNRWPLIEGVDRLAAQTDYFIGARKNWHAGVASFARVRYRSVYPGIDVVYYGKGSQLEYDFVLQPGAQPDVIRMRFSGPAKVRITPAGDLAVVTAEGLILQKKPSIYQQDRPVAGRYTLLADNVVGIHVDRYDRKQALVIDPVIVYSTLIGGSQTDQVTAMKMGPRGLLYITGWTQTGELPTSDMAYQNLTDAFVQIVDTTPAGGYQVVYSTYLGGTNLDLAQALDVDAAGFIYVAGSTTSADFPIAGNAVETTGAATTVDGFIAKIDPNAAGTGNSLVYSTYLGGAVGDDVVKGIAVDSGGMIYVTGTTKSPDFPVTDNAYAANLYGPSDVFVAKIDTNSTSLVYSTFMGSELDDDVCGIALGPNGVVYFAGTTAGTQFPMAGFEFSGFSAGNYDIVVCAVDTTKSGMDSLVFGTYWGGSDSEAARGMALDAQGRVLVTGYTLSADLPVTTATALQPNYAGNGDVFVAIFDVTKQGAACLPYATYLGGSEGEVAYGIAGDSAGYVYVTGYTLSSDFPTENAIQPDWGGGIDLFVTRFKPGVAGRAALGYSTYIGIDALIVGTCVTLDSAGNLYVGGYTEGYLPLLGTPVQPNYGGGFSDGFYFVVPGGNVSQNILKRQQRTDPFPHGMVPSRPHKQ